MSLIFHHLVQRDLRVVLRYYEEEGGIPLADRFFSELEQLTREIEENPSKFHKIHGEIRRANMHSSHITCYFAAIEKIKKFDRHKGIRDWKEAGEE